MKRSRSQANLPSALHRSVRLVLPAIQAPAPIANGALHLSDVTPVTAAELATLKNFFADDPPHEVPFLELSIPLHTRRVFQLKELWRIVYYRYNSLTDFAVPCRSYKEVSKLVDIRHDTVINILRRFVSNDHQLVLKRASNGGVLPNKLSLQVQNVLMG
jgi:hypothetical protein